MKQTTTTRGDKTEPRARIIGVSLLLQSSIFCLFCHEKRIGHKLETKETPARQYRTLRFKVGSTKNGASISLGVPLVFQRYRINSFPKICYEKKQTLLYFVSHGPIINLSDGRVGLTSNSMRTASGYCAHSPRPFLQTFNCKNDFRPTDFLVREVAATITFSTDQGRESAKHPSPRTFRVKSGTLFLYPPGQHILSWLAGLDSPLEFAFSVHR